MSTNASPLNVMDDPLPELVEGRFRVLSECTARGDQIHHDASERRVDEALRRARRLDEQIVRTIATSTSGLLAQLRLLSAFFDESTNGAGRRGALLIQSIAAGIQRFDAGDPAISSRRDARRQRNREVYARFTGRYDAAITLAAPGAAPVGLGSTGNPVFNVPASMLGIPALSLPLLSAEGLPLGLQVMGFANRDARLFATAAAVRDLLS